MATKRRTMMSAWANLRLSADRHNSIVVPNSGTAKQTQDDRQIYWRGAQDLWNTRKH
jgi:hypothetical protein